MGTGQNARRGNGDGDGLNYVPIPVPIPEWGLIFLPVPVPVPFGDGDFSPLRGGAPAGTVCLGPYNPKRLSLFLDCFLCPVSLCRELGIGTLAKCKNEKKEMLRLALTLFDTRLVDGVTMMQPFAEDATIKKIAVKSFPGELFSVLRTVHLLRGLSVGLGINYSCAEQWRPIAEEALRGASGLQGSLCLFCSREDRSCLLSPDETNLYPFTNAMVSRNRKGLAWDFRDTEA
ncbi:hypothetical protein Cgig2_020280 [Carnegiea gigantea]|uniref:Uncharacterized protein n=1 Tax=Carnegiea gigantea TaxID=171969 RepID=A0A9Q1QPP6_9CARY|nr:hypothetical protein Cgig2_020280 [Carnegiea gigantea]